MNQTNRIKQKNCDGDASRTKCTKLWEGGREGVEGDVGGCGVSLVFLQILH